MTDSLQLELTLISAIELLTASMALMLGILFLFSKSENKKANVFLGFVLLCLFGEVVDVLTQSIIDRDIWLVQTSLFTVPFLLLYIHQTMNSNNKPWFYLLFLAGIIQNILFFVGLDLQPFIYFEYLFNLSILVFILSVLKSHRKKVNDFYSELEHKSLHWIKVIVFIFFAFHVLWIIEDIIAFQNEFVIDYFAAASTVLTFFVVFWIGHNGFSQSETFKMKLFSLVKDEENEKEIDEQADEDALKYDLLCLKIQEGKLFTQAKLNLRSLSDRVDLNEKEISRLINQQSNQNFYQFINQFRVNEFKILLESEKATHLSLQGLAEEAGFNSKSTFYTAFKAMEGITPKQYELLLKKSE